MFLSRIYMGLKALLTLLPPQHPSSSSQQQIATMPRNATQTPQRSYVRRDYILADYPFRSEDADLILRTPDSYEFRVHKSTLLHSSSLPDKIYRLSEVATREFATTSYEPGLDYRGRPVAYVREDKDTLDLLLRLVYHPATVSAPHDVKRAFVVFTAAAKYGFEDAKRTAKRWIARAAESDPIHVYATASKNQPEMQAEAEIAAKASLGHDIEQLFSAGPLGNLPFSVYHNLRAYKQSCVTDALKLVQDLTWMGEVARVQNWKPCFLTCSDIACRDASQWARWFLEYLSIIKSALREDPRARTIVHMGVTGKAFAQARGCYNCRIRAAEDLRKFNDILSRKLRETIDEVSLPFCCT